jgi:hypothetical protein
LGIEATEKKVWTQTEIWSERRRNGPFSIGGSSAADWRDRSKQNEGGGIILFILPKIQRVKNQRARSPRMQNHHKERERKENKDSGRVFFNNPAELSKESNRTPIVASAGVERTRIREAGA